MTPEQPSNSSTTSPSPACSPELTRVMEILKQIEDQMGVLVDTMRDVEVRMADLERPY